MDEELTTTKFSDCQSLEQVALKVLDMLKEQNSREEIELDLEYLEAGTYSDYPTIRFTTPIGYVDITVATTF